MSNEPSFYTHRKATYPEIGTPEIRRQIGKELKSAREFQEMSLEQVTAITKINVRFLENIEEGRWAFLPPTYVKAFIRAYSAAVGLQTDKLSNRLDELFANTVVAIAPVQPQFLGDDGPEQLKMSGLMVWVEKHRAATFYGIIGIIAAILLGVYLYQSGDRLMSAWTDRAEAVDTTTQAVSSPAEPVVQTVAAPIDTAAHDTLAAVMLKIVSHDSCSVKIESGDSTAYEKVLWPGNTVELTVQQPVRLSLGNAPAVQVSIDGRQLPPFPSSRRLQIIKLGPGGVIG